MKTTFRVILVVLVAAFYSCNNENVSNADSSITTDGVLSGTIVNNAFAQSDSIQVEYFYFDGRGSVTNDGKFELALSIPHLRQMGSIRGVTVSDTTALIGNALFSSYSPNSKSYELLKCNFTTDSITQAGMAYSIFIYADRALTIKGTAINTIKYGAYTKTETIVYNLKLKKGWNEFVEKVDSYVATDTTITIKMTYSNAITSDLQWRYLPNYKKEESPAARNQPLAPARLYRVGK